MSDDRPVQLFTSGPPSTVVPEPASQASQALEHALGVDPSGRRAAVAAVVAKWPRYVDAWARLGDLGRDEIERYAAYRVGYHRGLDELRANGWRGSGYVRWAAESNRGFLRAMRGLGQMAQAIGEDAEAERIHVFILQLEPSGVPAEG